MGAYLQNYGEGEESRVRVVRVAILCLAGLVVIGVAAFLLLQNAGEKKKANAFLALLNQRDYQVAYQLWGCTAEHPCPNYTFERFMKDWGPDKNAGGPWRVSSVDSCRQFLTVNVQAPRSEMESLSVLRSDLSLGFAPDAECQERKWRWKQFFQQYFGATPAPPKPHTGA